MFQFQASGKVQSKQTPINSDESRAKRRHVASRPEKRSQQFALPETRLLFVSFVSSVETTDSPALRRSARRERRSPSSVAGAYCGGWTRHPYLKQDVRSGCNCLLT